MGAYAKYLTERGGLATCGEHLGVMVASRECDKQCPAGWVFVPIEQATEEIVQAALDQALLGRKAWPVKET